MVNCLLAGIPVQFENQYPELAQLCRGYETELPPAFHISVSAVELEQERRQQPGEFSNGYLETVCSYRQAANRLLERNVFVMHASVVALDGEAYAFLAPSGVGKTTQTRLWQQYFGRRLQVINGDKPLIAMECQGQSIQFRAYGTPWRGKEGMGCKASAPLKALFFLRRGDTPGAAPAGHAQSVELLSPIMREAMTHAVAAYLLVGGVALAVLLVYPFGRKAAQDQLQSVGLANHAGMAPDLLRKRRDRDNPRVTVWEFRNQSIPLTVWEDKRASIEAALDVSIVKMVYGKTKSRVLVYAVPTQTSLPDVLWWSDTYLSPDSFVLTLGESLTGPVTVNLAHIPHILLGGSTGSGKSVLLKLLLMQSLRKGAEVYIADFKGGVDFPKVWHQKCRMCFTEADLLYTLNQLVAVLEYRKGRLAETGCPNLDTYNEATGEDLPRLVFACDEVAEVLDKTGADAERKKLLAQIESKLATIARLGRAFGIHLILATQRPDATIIPGQIKNNLDFRVCGRAESVLSSIILDNGSAAEQIPKDARGRFITGDGTVFQGFLFDDRQL